MNKAQNCGCYDCNLAIPANTVDTFEFDFTNVINDDLSDPNQGVCGVEIRFNQDRIRGMEMVLISPSGQEIKLIGSNLVSQLNTTTINTEWNITFVRSIDPASPDSGFPSVWSNANNWVLGGLYNGTYYPNMGNLEDFNTGPVNGTWRLVVRNFNPGFTGYEGNIVDFRIILCDPDGIECCFANGGVLSGIQFYNRCLGDSTLRFTPQIFLGNNIPDTNLYAYQWIYAQDTVIIKYDSIVDFRSFPQGNYELCGMSYLIEDLDSLPQPDGMLRWDSLDFTLEYLDPNYCADVTNKCVKVRISPPPAPVNISGTICQGDTFPVGDSLFTNTGTYMVPIRLSTGCDSIVELDLTVLQPDTTFLNETICEGENFMVGDSIYSEAGIHITGISIGEICDSIIKLDLNVLPLKDTTINVAICQGDTLFVLDTIITMQGSYQVTRNVGTNGCDSTVTANVTVLNPQSVIAMPDTLNCTRPGITVFGNGSTPSQINYFWFTPDGNISGPSNLDSITALSPGQYYLRVSLDTLGTFCADEASVIVIEDNNSPIADIISPDTLTCNRTSVFVNGLNSSSGPEFEYEWYEAGVGILAGEITGRITVDRPGFFKLIVRNTLNGCLDSMEVEVVQDTLPPFADAGPTLELNCRFTQDTLNGSGSSQGSDFQYSWTGPGFICCQNTAFPVIQNPGTYHIQVLNNRTGCVSSDSVVITRNILVPSANAGTPDTLNCLINQLVLGATASAGPNFSYLWTTTDGQITSGETTVAPTISAAGTYVFTVTNNVNFCENTDSVLIEIDTILPEAHAGPDLNITCQNDTVTLFDVMTSTGSNFVYQWSRDGSVFVPQGSAGPSLDTDLGGAYVLQVWNSKNNCVSSDTTLVGYDTVPPVVDAGIGFEINCTVERDTLFGTANSNGNPLNYNWYTNSNCFESDTTAQFVIVNCEGWYYLEVTDVLTGCLNLDSVEVTRDAAAPIADAGPRDTINCNQSQVQLQGNALPIPPSTTINWTTPDGNIVSGGNTTQPVVDQAGTYIISVTSLANNCVKFDTVEIFMLLDTPVVDAGPDKEINCDTLQVDLFGANSSNGPQYSFQWLDGSGNPISGANQLNYSTNIGGTYILEITNNLSHCFNRDTVEVRVDTLLPTVDAGPPMTIDCQNQTVFLDGTGSDTGPQFNFVWQTDTGRIVSGGSTLMPEVDAGGLYVLTILNRNNFCISMDSVLVSQDASLPNVVVNPNEQLDCNTYELTLDGTGSAMGPNITYNWTTTNGNILSGAMTLNPMINAPGVYQLEVVDTDNNCSARAIVTVQDTVGVLANAGPDVILDCNDLNTGVYLDGSNSSQGINIVYEWSTFGGSIVGNPDTISPLINDAGLYGLVVRDTITGCRDEDEALASIGGAIPIAEAGNTQILPCGVDTATLDGTSSTPGMNILFQWTTSTGSFLSNSDSSVVLVDSSGWYILTVQDTTSGCISVDSVQINFLPCGPGAFAIAPDTVNCLVDTVRLDASGSNQVNTVFSWTTTNGNILKDSFSIFPLVTAGNYQLEVRDTITGLTGTFDVEVPVDTLSPTAITAQANDISCRDTLILLDGSGSSTGNNIEYQWSGPGNILSADSIQSQANTGGTFRFIVRNIINGCADTSSVVVNYDTIAPIADAGLQKTFPCDTSFITLDGSGSSQGPNFIYQWSNNVGALMTNVLQPGQFCLTVTDTTNGCFAIDCVDVIPDQNAPVIEAGMDTLLTCQDTLVTLMANVPNGNFSINWSTQDGCYTGVDTTANLDVHCTGTYLLTVVNNDNRCVSTDQVVVGDNFTFPQSEAGAPSTFICNQNFGTLDGTMSQTGLELVYNWTGPGVISDETTLTPSITTVGTFYLTVTDTITGCSGIDSVIVSYDTIAPVANAGADRELSCSTTQLSLSGSGSSLGPDFQYFWQEPRLGSIVSGQTSLNPLISNGGMYVLVVTDTSNNCLAADTVLVTSDTIAPIIVLNDQNPYQVDCSKDTVQLSAANSSPSGLLAFRWSTFSGNIISNPVQANVVVDEPGWYFVSVEHTRNGCSSRDSVEVTGDFATPSLSLLPPDPITCDSMIVSVEAVIPANLTNYSISWVSQNGNILSDTSQVGIRVNLAERYTATLTNNLNGCQTTESIRVPIDTMPPVAMASASDEIDCFNQTVSLSGQGSSNDGTNFLYNWTTSNGGNISGGSSLNPVVDATGWYVLTVRDTRNGCTQTDSVEVVENAPPIGDINIISNSPRCYGEQNGSILIDSVQGGTPPFLYNFDGQGFQPFGSLNNLNPGVYRISIQDAAGCEVDTVIIVEDKIELVIDLGTELTVALGDSTELEALINIPATEVDTLIWTPENLINCPGCYVQIVSPPVTTIFTVTLVDKDGCRATDRIEVVLDKTRQIYIPSAFSPNGDNINDKFMIFGGKGISQIDLFQVYDRWGNILHQAENFDPGDPFYGWDGTFQGKMMNEAVFVYMAKITFLDGRTEVFSGDFTLIKN
ncbi:MAG: gliding motility-associated C-terminal domain-containing protein [Saprospiraceae bacterium]